MLARSINKKATLFTLSLVVISVSMLLLLLGYFIGASHDFLKGFATSTMVIGFGMLIAAFAVKLKTGKVPDAKMDERDMSIAYKAGFTTYVITLFSLCIFTFAAFSTKFTIDVPAKILSTITILFMSVCFYVLMFIFKKIM